MFNEIFNVMKCFPKSYITQFGELILSDKGNVYFTAKDCNTQKDIICKLLEWCSRPLAKGEPYRQEKRNKEWRESLLSGYNEYLGTQFTQEDMYWIYDKLGNAVNHELTLKFITSGYAEADCAGEVLWDDETMSFQVTNRLSAESYEVLGECSVIGNIFDNPESLESEG